jgi:hypothetical protein
MDDCLFSTERVGEGLISLLWCAKDRVNWTERSV